MEHHPHLAPCLIGNGTLARPRDMVRALETLEGLAYAWIVDGESMSEGRAALVKLMADDSATLLVNECLFLNVRSFRYLTFETSADGTCSFELHGDGTVLRLTPDQEVDARVAEREGMQRMEYDAFGPGAFVLLEEDDEGDV